MHIIFVRLIVSLGVLCCVQALPAADKFIPLGFLEGGKSSSAMGVSLGGKVVCGTSGSDKNQQTFRWTEETGMVGLGSLGGPVPGGTSNWSAAFGISDDGTTIVGATTSTKNKVPKSAIPLDGYRWTAQDGMVALDENVFLWPKMKISAHGDVVSCNLRRAARRQRVAWTSTQGIIPAPDTLNGERSGAVGGVSANGKVIFGTLGKRREAFAWHSTGNVIWLGDLPGGKFQSAAWDASASGHVIVGTSSSDKGFEAYVWTQKDGMKGLGDLPGGEYNSEARAVSNDGRTIVGLGTTGEVRLQNGTMQRKQEAFIWTAETGMQNLREVMTRRGLDLSNWTLSDVMDISGDGKAIVGWGLNPMGKTEAWLILLDVE